VRGTQDQFGSRAGFALLFGALLWAVSVVVAPATAKIATPGSPASFASVAVYAVGGLVCHQRADRSFHTAGVRWPVCARCAGLYGGAGMAALILLVAPRPWRSFAAPTRPLIVFLIVAALPTAASWGAERLGVIGFSNGARAAFAAPLGIVVAALVAHASWTGAARQVR